MSLWAEFDWTEARLVGKAANVNVLQLAAEWNDEELVRDKERYMNTLYVGILDWTNLDELPPNDRAFIVDWMGRALIVRRAEMAKFN